MKKEQIIKVLEYCFDANVDCSLCPMTLTIKSKHKCTDKLLECALALIKELTEDNERLRAEVSVKKNCLINA